MMPNPPRAALDAALQFQAPGYRVGDPHPADRDTGEQVRDLLARAAIADEQARQYRKQAGRLLATMDIPPEFLDQRTVAHLIELATGGRVHGAAGISTPNVYKTRERL